MKYKPFYLLYNSCCNLHSASLRLNDAQFCVPCFSLHHDWYSCSATALIQLVQPHSPVSSSCFFLLAYLLPSASLSFSPPTPTHDVEGRHTPPLPCHYHPRHRISHCSISARHLFVVSRMFVYRLASRCSSLMRDREHETPQFNPAMGKGG